MTTKNLKKTVLTQAIKALLLSTAFTYTSANAKIEEKVSEKAVGSPQIIDREQIQRTGLTNLGDIINELVITRGFTFNQFSNNPGDGSVGVNLGNLGSQRVLVLLNGQRMAKTSFDTYDFTGIPISIVGKIEISHGDTEKTYGMSAAAGMINIVTNAEKEGMQTGAYYGKSNQGDAETQLYNLAYSHTSEKSSVFFNAEYVKNAAISAGDRDISALSLYGTGNTRGSSATPQGRFLVFLPNDFSLVDFTTAPESNGWNTPTDPDLIAFNQDLQYNFAPENFLLTPQQRKSIYIQNRYQINEKVQFNADLLFNQREAQRMFAPEPLFIGFLIGNREGIDIGNIGIENPYNPLGIEIPSTYVYLIGRRLIEAGNRKVENNVDTFHLNVGLEGFSDFSTGWDWNVSYVYSHRKEEIIGHKRVDKRQVFHALSNACVSEADCVPLNLFGGEGTITPEMLNYIMRDTYDSNKSVLDVFRVHLNSEVLEVTSGTINFDLDYQYRRHQLTIIRDELFLKKLTSTNQYFANTEGEYDVNEINMNVVIPLLSNTDKNLLDLNLTTTYSKYDFTNGELSGGLGLNFIPSHSFQIGLEYSMNKQAPGLVALLQDSLKQDSIVSDPCSFNTTLPGCVSGGIPFNDFFNPEISFSGNNKLNLEQSELWQLSFLYEPELLENLSIYTRFFKQKITDVVNKVSAQRILSTCAYTGSLYCDNITRTETSPYFVTAIRSSFFNDTEIKTSGIEAALNYAFNTDLATFSINWQSVYLDKSEFLQKDYSDNSVDNVSFLNLDFNATELPQLKSNLNLNASRGNWNINYQVRYIGGYEERCSPRLVNDLRPTTDSQALGGIVSENFRWCTYDSSDFNPEPVATIDAQPILHNRRHAGGASFHDINVSYKIPKYKANLTIGIENIFDKTPPLSVNASANSYQTYLYNGTGRFFWVRISKDF